MTVLILFLLVPRSSSEIPSGPFAVSLCEEEEKPDKCNVVFMCPFWDPIPMLRAEGG